MSEDQRDFLVLHLSGKAVCDSPKHVQRPAWSMIEEALDLAFERGGNVILEIEQGAKASFVKELCMQSIGRQYRIIALRAPLKTYSSAAWLGKILTSPTPVYR